MATLRDAVLDAMVRLERRHGRETFDLADIVQEVLRNDPDAKEVSVRTHMTSVMCREAPVHHANHTNDLERVARGRYRRLTDAEPAPDGRKGPQSTLPPPTADTRQDLPTDVLRPWNWEGHVQERFVEYLRAEGWTVHSTADTASREQGADVVAERDGELLVAEVKGFPTTTYARGPKIGQPKKTNPGTQARVWFAGVLFEAMLRREKYPKAQIAIVLPSEATYDRLVGRVAESIRDLGFAVFRVEQSGRCRELELPD